MACGSDRPRPGADLGEQNETEMVKVHPAVLSGRFAGAGRKLIVAMASELPGASDSWWVPVGMAWGAVRPRADGRHLPGGTSRRFVRRVERAADLGQDPLVHGQDGPEGQPLSRIVSPALLCPGHRLAGRLAGQADRVEEPLPVG